MCTGSNSDQVRFCREGHKAGVAVMCNGISTCCFPQDSPAEDKWILCCRAAIARIRGQIGSPSLIPCNQIVGLSIVGFLEERRYSQFDIQCSCIRPSCSHSFFSVDHSGLQYFRWAYLDATVRWSCPIQATTLCIHALILFCTELE